jgi:hypothetical protein
VADMLKRNGPPAAEKSLTILRGKLREQLSQLRRRGLLISMVKGVHGMKIGKEKKQRMPCLKKLLLLE